MAVKGLIFDMDGTLVDSMGFSRDYRRLLCEKHNVPVDGEFADLLDYHSDWEEFRKRFSRYYKPFEDAAFFWATFYATMGEFYAEHAAPLPGVLPFLQAMKARGYQLGVATATPRNYATLALERAGLLPLMDVILSTKDVGAEKHRPDVYLECARLLGDLSKEEVVVFEDDCYCIQTLHTHGFTTVGVHDRNTPDHEWDALIPLCSRTIEDYRELL